LLLQRGKPFHEKISSLLVHHELLLLLLILLALLLLLLLLLHVIYRVAGIIPAVIASAEDIHVLRAIAHALQDRHGVVIHYGDGHG
jgi:hypothetical protein